MIYDEQIEHRCWSWYMTANALQARRRRGTSWTSGDKTNNSPWNFLFGGGLNCTGGLKGQSVMFSGSRTVKYQWSMINVLHYQACFREILNKLMLLWSVMICTLFAHCAVRPRGYSVSRTTFLSAFLHPSLPGPDTRSSHLQPWICSDGSPLSPDCLF